MLFAVFLARTIILRPFSDMMSWIDAYLQMRERRGDLLEYLWAPHNEHHMPIIRLLTALDISTFHASGVPFVIAATTALVASGRRTERGRRPTRRHKHHHVAYPDLQRLR